MLSLYLYKEIGQSKIFLRSESGRLPAFSRAFSRTASAAQAERAPWPCLEYILTPRRSSWRSTLLAGTASVGPALRGGGWVPVPIASPFVPVLAGVLVPELQTARENARLEIRPQRGRNSHHIDVLGIYGLQGLSCGRTELLVADMRLLAPPVYVGKWH